MLAFMIYAAVASATIAAGMWLVERFLTQRRFPTRWLWFASLVAMMTVMFLPVARPPVATINSGVSTMPRDVGQISAAPMPAVVARSVSGARRSVPLDLLLIAAWALASAIGFAILAGSAWRIARMQRDWKPAEIAGVPVMLSHDVGPAIVGLFHHGVVMPAWVSALTPVQQRLIVTHEREHVRAGDPLLLWGATFLVVLFPWNLGMWLALRGLRHAIEMDCDARVLHAQPDTHAYCSLLLDVGERTLAGVAPLAALAEPSTLLERRVEVMTARVSMSPKTVGSLAAGIVLVIAGCVASRTPVAPQRDAVTLARELSELLRSDAVVASIPLSDRERLATRLTPASDSIDDHGVARRSYTEWKALLVPSVDSVLTRFYPALNAITGKTRMLVILTYTYEGRLEGHEIMDVEDALSRKPEIEGIDGMEIVRPKYISRLSSTDTYQLVIHERRPKLHAEVLIRIRRGPVRMTAVPRMPSAGADADAADAVPALQFSRRADSLARADFPAAFQPHAGHAYVVGALFSAEGKILNKNGRQLPVAQVYDTIPGGPNLGARDVKYLLNLLGFGAIPQLSKAGSDYSSNVPHTVIIWGLVEP
jgi:beta-lactamase regulating signal transducer with metallopeptidase domain